MTAGHQADLRALLDRRHADRQTERGQQLAAPPRRVQLEGDLYHVIVPPGAVRIDRGTILGNPFKVETYGLDLCLDWYERYLAGDPEAVEEARTRPQPVKPWKSWRTNGHGLIVLADQRIGTSPVACRCGPDQRCHGDLLLAAVDRCRRGEPVSTHMWPGGEENR